MGLKGSKMPEARVLLLGLDGAGKSTILFKLKYNQQCQTFPTIGFNVEMIDAKHKRRKIVLTVWDIGGQKKMRVHWKDFYQDTAGLLFVVDCSDKCRLDEARRELEHILKNEQLKGLPLVIFANKQDVEGAATATEITEKFTLRKICCGRDWFVQPCSSARGAGLQDGFRKMVHLVKTSSDDNIKETVKYLRAKSLKSVRKYQ
ncbi:ADP-ribosylation factor-like protein 14 [Brachyhypopomus gauderio]|uniref:ADP-ribosylation factor-like protein 14 n=1 Tax=Brachyhypopomus gauderio TaxID=698409 RepID=UPI0040431244